MSKEEIPSALELAKHCARLLENKKAENVSILKVSDVTIVSDYFVICTATSRPHLASLAEWIKRQLRDYYNLRPSTIDGKSTSNWIVIDFGNVILHCLTEETREKYQIEKLWGDAEEIKEFFVDKTK